jgi:mannose-6-phosphate isomerase-like protein (cupin superfamily)
MQFAELEAMQGGWFAGNFAPTLVRTSSFETAVKRYRAGDREPSHHHKAAREITVIVSGRARMCDRVLKSGDIVLLEPNESTAFEALEDTVTVVVKTPSVPGDKFLD